MIRPPDSLSDAVRRALPGTEQPLAVLLDSFLDRFYEAGQAERHAMIAEEPPRTGIERDDAYLAAMAEYLAERWGLQAPEWTQSDGRQVSAPWFVGRMGIGLSGLLLVESPAAFRRRNIFTEADPLRRARMPAPPRG
jgi:hypothetical protein